MRKRVVTPATPWHTGEAVREILGESNRAKASAAMAMGTTITTLYRWLRDQEWPQRNIEKAAAYFGVSEEWLMFGTGDKYVSPSGGNDPKAAQAEQLYMRFKLQMETLMQKYTREIARVYGGEDAQTPRPMKGTRREWDTKAEKDL